MAANKPLRQSINIPLGNETVSVDVDWTVIEIVERTFGGMADLVVTDTLVNFPPRYQVAEVIGEWVSRATRDHNKADVRETVITSRHYDFGHYVGAIQGAVLYSLREIDENQLESLASGQDIDAGGGAEEDPT